ncbi:hypothetical protein [uncultured Roseobacter sp.]|uniref:hypothetical protein n=1 Tax=uncultured Roseobacter sp. TaxID=114847 RepID=UPI002606DB5C|nr:hypothetical protein [uncultured Roseobacter sp.]
MYSIEDLEAAKAELTVWERRLENYNGNNPDKYQADLKTARRKVRHVTEALKATGTLKRTFEEELQSRLDAAFPNARSKEIVEFEGRRFQKRFYPLERSRSAKTVTEWGREWTRL